MTQISNFTSRSLLLGLMHVLLIPTVTSAQVRGRVTGDDQTPLAGVTVWSVGEEVTTSTEGVFTLSMRMSSPRNGQHVVRASAPGYRPVTKLVQDRSSVTFSLQRDPAGVWKAPWCNEPPPEVGEPRLNTETAMYGSRIRFFVPQGARIQAQHNLESSRNLVCRDGDCLAHSWGGIGDDGISGIIGPDLLVGVKDMRERDVFDVTVGVNAGAEYRGIHENGTYRRAVGIFGERVVYVDARKSSAELFDKIIDSLCWLRERS